MEVDSGPSTEIQFLQKSCDTVDQINQKLLLVSKNLERLNDNVTRVNSVCSKWIDIWGREN